VDDVALQVFLGSFGDLDISQFACSGNGGLGGDEHPSRGWGPCCCAGAGMFWQLGGRFVAAVDGVFREGAGECSVHLAAGNCLCFGEDGKGGVHLTNHAFDELQVVRQE
jgi:hypothetical protein